MNRLRWVPLIIAVILLIAVPMLSRTDLESTVATEVWFKSRDYQNIMTRISTDDDPVLFYGNRALENCIYVHPDLEPYRYEGDIEWSVGNKTNTWFLYFESLQVVGYLANAAEISGNACYLEKAAGIIESWFDFDLNNPSPPPYAWNEAAVGFRVRNVMHFLRAYATLPSFHLPDSLFLKIHTMLNEHAEFLLQDCNYRPNNHGLMDAMALAQIALTFPEFDHSGLCKETSLKRIRERISADLSAENVHLENSAFYHLYFLNLILQVNDYLEGKGIALFPPGDDTIKDMEDYLAYLVMPNGQLPRVGDTSDLILTKDYDNDFIRYSLSRGIEGSRPPASSLVCPGAGVAILRDGWKSGSESPNTTYLFFQCAFHSTTHKHADDLGFVLYSHGEDIFVGPGVYAYGSSKYRQYVTSAQAHNTLTVDGKSFEVSTDNIGKASITAYSLEEAFDFVQGSHSIYDGVTLKRSIVFIRPSTILVIDEAVSGTEHAIQQIWNLSPAAYDLRFDSGGASFRLGEDAVKVEIRQLGAIADVRHYKGQEEPVRGFTSPRQNTLIPIDQLEFENSGKHVVFVTQVSVIGPGDILPQFRLDYANPYSNIEVIRVGAPSFLIDLSKFAANPGVESQK